MELAGEEAERLENCRRTDEQIHGLGFGITEFCHNSGATLCGGVVLLHRHNYCDHLLPFYVE